MRQALIFSTFRFLEIYFYISMTYTHKKYCSAFLHRYGNVLFNAVIWVLLKTFLTNILSLKKGETPKEPHFGWPWLHMESFCKCSNAKPSFRRFWWLPVIFLTFNGYLLFFSSKVGDLVSLNLKLAVFKEKIGENLWLHEKLYDIHISRHTCLESCWIPANFGTVIVGGLSIFSAARIFSTLQVMVVTQILESL